MNENTIGEIELAYVAASELLEILIGQPDWATLVQQLSWLHVTLENQLVATDPLIDEPCEAVPA